jgi:hypothetical protein
MYVSTIKKIHLLLFKLFNQLGVFGEMNQNSLKKRQKQSTSYYE